MARSKKSSAVAPTVPFSEPLLVTTAAAAELLSVSTWEVRRLIRKGLLAHKRLSKTHWLIPMKSVRAFAEVSANGRAA
jgi:excisionase family DNA binding protein